MTNKDPSKFTPFGLGFSVVPSAALGAVIGRESLLAAPRYSIGKHTLISNAAPGKTIGKYALGGAAIGAGLYGGELLARRAWKKLRNRNKR